MNRKLTRFRIAVFAVGMMLGMVLVSKSHAGEVEHKHVAAVDLQQQQQQQTANPVQQVTEEGTKFPKLAPTAIAPSVSTGVDCAITQQESKAFSLFFASFSGTTGVSFTELCYAFKRNQTEVADTLACVRSTEYADANEDCAWLIAKYNKRKAIRKGDTDSDFSSY